MDKNEKNYIALVLLHVAIGALIYLIQPISKLYGFSIFILGL
jgi:hypothetical protein